MIVEIWACKWGEQGEKTVASKFPVIVSPGCGYKALRHMKTIIVTGKVIELLHDIRE